MLLHRRWTESPSSFFSLPGAKAWNSCLIFFLLLLFTVGTSLKLEIEERRCKQTFFKWRRERGQKTTLHKASIRALLFKVAFLFAIARQTSSTFLPSPLTLHPHQVPMLSESLEFSLAVTDLPTGMSVFHLCKKMDSSDFTKKTLKSRQPINKEALHPASLKWWTKCYTHIQLYLIKSSKASPKGAQEGSEAATKELHED